MKDGQKEKIKEFVWSDDEAELLLNVCNDYKVTKAAESIDWESVKSKYSDIYELFIQALPDEDSDVLRSFPHKKEEITKVIVTSKLKAIRMKFRQAVDSGRRSGHGRVVMIFHELCEKVWGGSPATEQIDGGVESVDLIINSPLTDPQEKKTYQHSSADGENSGVGVDNASCGDTSLDENVLRDTSLTGDASVNGETSDTLSRAGVSNAEISDDEGGDGSENTQGRPESTDPSGESMKVTVRQRRELLDDRLKNYEQDKMKRKLPIDTQLLGCVQEELQIKKRIVERMEKMDEKYTENMERMSNNMEKLTQSIADGFALLKQVMMYQQPVPPSMYHPPPFNPYMQGSAQSYDSRIPSYPSSNHKSSSVSSSPPYDLYENFDRES